MYAQFFKARGFLDLDVVGVSRQRVVELRVDGLDSRRVESGFAHRILPSLPGFNRYRLLRHLEKSPRPAPPSGATTRVARKSQGRAVAC